MPELISFIKKFQNLKVLIIGDVMLDRYWWGSVSRISPEAPVPVVNLQKTSLVAGGAANVAANVAGLGAEPILIGATGDDEEAKLFPKVLANAKISVKNLIKLKHRPTIIKTRIVAHNQHVVRIDQEQTKYLDSKEEKKVWQMIEKEIGSAAVVVVSDYAKGLLTENLLRRIIEASNQLNQTIVIDPKGQNYQKYRGATLLTPNRYEAAQALGLSAEDENLVEIAGEKLMEKLNLQASLITQGENGMTLFQKNQKSTHFEALARKVYDVTGAGDTVAACIAVAAGAGATLPQAAEIANISAGLVVEEIGTTAITKKNLEEALNNLE